MKSRPFITLSMLSDHSIFPCKLSYKSVSDMRIVDEVELVAIFCSINKVNDGWKVIICQFVHVPIPIFLHNEVLSCTSAENDCSLESVYLLRLSNSSFQRGMSGLWRSRNECVMAGRGQGMTGLWSVVLGKMWLYNRM